MKPRYDVIRDQRLTSAVGFRRSSLELMLSLLDSDSSTAESDESNSELRKNRDKVGSQESFERPYLRSGHVGPR